MYGKDQKLSKRKVLVVLIDAFMPQATRARVPQNLRPRAGDGMCSDLSRKLCEHVVESILKIIEKKYKKSIFV